MEAGTDAGRRMTEPAAVLAAGLHAEAAQVGITRATWLTPAEVAVSQRGYEVLTAYLETLPAGDGLIDRWPGCGCAAGG